MVKCKRLFVSKKSGCSSYWAGVLNADTGTNIMKKMSMESNEHNSELFELLGVEHLMLC